MWMPIVGPNRSRQAGVSLLQGSQSQTFDEAAGGLLSISTAGGTGTGDGGRAPGPGAAADDSTNQAEVLLRIFSLFGYQVLLMVSQ